ncbi:MAG: hypothetical protein HZC41_04380 [Chloroflexi bacterium]|nr:hypothetical protein [Chloroflexota bacterium]
MLHTTFDQPLSLPWRITESGAGKVYQQPGQLRLTDYPTPDGTYSNAQISDYATRRDFMHRPPVRMTITAWATTTAIHGTAGFGFWNHLYAPDMRGLRLPRALWFFFAGPPNNIRLARDVPGSGWKAMTLDATRLPFLALLPTAPVGFLLMRVPALFRALWPVGQWALGASDYALDAALLPERHTYTLDWHTDGVSFAVDDHIVHHTQHSPRGPLGFVAWIDNQYAIVTPQGQFGFGLVPLVQEQTLILESVRIEPSR